MPLYDYQCRACRQVTEVRHGFREAHEGACPACGGELARVFNPAGILFKGSGFYITDSRKASAASDSSSSSTGSTGSTGSTSSSGAAPSTSSTPAASDSGSKKSESSAA